MLFLSFNQSDSIVPNYDYMCDKEGTLIVFDLPMDHKIPLCQACGIELRRVYTAVPAIFKGSGWAGKSG
jgi:predicted nucleic acid-binding Zn ribbon protein